MKAPRILGLMSGTSADGIDAALLELPGWPALGSGGLGSGGLGSQATFPALSGPVPRGRVVAHQFTPFAPELRQAVLRAMRGEATTPELTQLHWWLGEALAGAAAPLAADADLIASHGQTVQHQPQPDAERGWQRPATLQLGEASVIAEMCGKPVVADFRAADMAAGGVGAPLVPFADWALFADEGISRVLLNVGGLANITYLPGADPAGVLAFDTGPGNCLIDEVADEGISRVLLNVGGLANITYLPGADPAGVLAFDTGPGNCLIDEVAEMNGQTYDEGGALAAQGRPDPATLLGWLGHPELQKAPPKATGREVWSLPQLKALGLNYSGLSLPDLAATATALTARTIADALRFLPARPDEVVIAGGGAKNPVLRRELQAALDNIPLRTFADLGWDAAGFTESTREAAAFAFLGYGHAQGWPNTLPQTTGARHAVSGGKLTPAPHLNFYPEKP